MLSDSLFDEHWYRVKRLKPCLASDITIHRHVYKGVPYFLLHRKSINQIFRASSQTMELIGAFNGKNTIEELWNIALEKHGEQASTQTQLIDLMGQLHEAELLRVDRRMQAEHLFARSENKNSMANNQRYLNPLFMRFNLLDPDLLLTKLGNKLRWMSSPFFILCSFVFFLVVLLEIIPDWSQLRYEIATTDLLSAQYIGMFFVIYPLMKLIHELAHGVILKRLGGEVHEFGIALMVFLPIPYVDATTASLLADKRHRIFVSAAGISVECGLAAIAALIWSRSQGILHDASLLVMMIGCVSTVLFNANPLLKFDGYYILADWLELPNLANRSKRLIQDDLGRYLLGIDNTSVEIVDIKEKWQLRVYGILSILYRIGLMLFIAWMISQKFFFFGVLVALFILFALIVKPLWRLVHFLKIQKNSIRQRALGVTTGLIIFAFIVLFLIPLPYNTTGKAVVWLPESAMVRAASDCEIKDLLVEPGSEVNVGDELFFCDDPTLATSISVLQAKLDEVSAKAKGLEVRQRVERSKLETEVRSIAQSLAREKEKFSQQILKARTSGRFVSAANSGLIGRFFSHGDIAAYIIPARIRTVRMAIEQSDVSLISKSIQKVELMFAENIDSGKTHISSILRQTPKADRQVPSAALSTLGGGSLLADPEGDGTTLQNPVFDIELTWPESAPDMNVGSHVFVKLEHAPVTLVLRAVGNFKRAFLGRTEV